MQRLVALRRSAVASMRSSSSSALVLPTARRGCPLSSSSAAESAPPPHPPSPPAVPAEASPASSAAAAVPAPPPAAALRDFMKHVAMSPDEQEALFRQGGKELVRAWKQEGGIKPNLARFERALHGQDLDAMERGWKELRKEGMDFWHFQKFMTILLDDRHLNVREGPQATNPEAAKQRLRVGWSIFEHMLAAAAAAPAPVPTTLPSAAAAAPGDLKEEAPRTPTPSTNSHHWGRMYNALLKACAVVGDGWRAKELSDHMDAAGFLPGEEALSAMVVALSKSRIRHEAQEQFERARRRGVILSAAAKSCLISCQARALDGTAAAQVLDASIQEARLNDNPGQVSGNMVKKVLEVGIETGDVDVLKRGLAALSVPVDRGMGLQILNVAARKGDGLLAMDMFYALESWGYAPTASAFNAVLQALVLSKNDVAMLKALNEMCAWGFAPSPGTLHLIAKQLSQSVARLDDAYNNLVALRKTYQDHLESPQDAAAAGVSDAAHASVVSASSVPPTPPPLPVSAPAVYLIVLGCAYANQLDRGFATFEDYGPVFGLQHDTPVCNALLLACLRSRSLQVGAATSVMTEMDRLNVAPDQETCHLMVRILVQAKEPDVAKMEQTLAFMDRKGVAPRADTLRLLVLWHALLGEHDRAQELLSGLQAQGAFIPSYLGGRLEQIKEHGDRL